MCHSRWEESVRKIWATMDVIVMTNATNSKIDVINMSCHILCSESKSWSDVSVTKTWVTTEVMKVKTNGCDERLWQMWQICIRSTNDQCWRCLGACAKQFLHHLLFVFVSKACYHAQGKFDKNNALVGRLKSSKK